MGGSQASASDRPAQDTRGGDRRPSDSAIAALSQWAAEASGASSWPSWGAGAEASWAPTEPAAGEEPFLGFGFGEGAEWPRATDHARGFGEDGVAAHRAREPVAKHAGEDESLSASAAKVEAHAAAE